MQTYIRGAMIAWFPIAIATWIYAAVVWGLAGVTFGWITGIVVATIACWFWPVWMLGLLTFAYALAGGFG
jgi:hypothetical protein